MNYIIDATDQIFGRVASRAAAYLRGKSLPSFQRHQAPGVKVKITNADRLNWSGRKRQTKTYTRYTGYPGGLKFVSLEEMMLKHGSAEVFRVAIRRMLPNNKLRSKLLKNLIVEK